MGKPEEQMKIIMKGVHTLVNQEELLAKIQKSYKHDKPLTIKLGLDPSAPDIHLGYAVVLRKIKQMQDMGHKAVIVIGDFTGKIGDPTGKSKGRRALSEEQVKENAQTYCEQIFKVLDWNKTEVMQAYDSVELEADIELGGTDQTFNILMGRTLQKTFNLEQQVAIFMPILEGLDGSEKMSKSLGNYIGVCEPAQVMFKKVMEVPDHLIIKYFELATDVHPDKIQKIRDELEQDANPRDIKYQLAQIITGLYHTQEELDKAIEFYNKAFGEKMMPANIPELVIDWDKDTVLDVISQLVQNDFVKSKSEFIRLVKQKGIQIEGEKLDIEDLNRVLFNGDVMRIGKKKFVKFVK